MIDFFFVLSPFFLAWWLSGWPGKTDPAAVKTAGLSFVFFGISMLLCLVFLGRQMPASKYGNALMTTTGTLRFCMFIAAVGAIVLLVHAYFSRKGD